MDIEKIAKNQDESFKKAVWFILKKIQQKRNEKIESTFFLELFDLVTSPSKEFQRSILTFLENTGAINIQQRLYSKYDIGEIYYRFENIFGNGNNKHQLYLIRVNNKKFSKIYSFYKNLYEKYDYAQFDQDSGTLTLCEKNIVFSRKSHLLLSALFYKKDDYYTVGKLLDFQTANEFIGKIDPAESLDNRSFYGARDNINKKICENTNIRDEFILLESSSMKINNIYLLQ